MNKMDNKRYLTIKEASEHLGVSRQLLYKKKTRFTKYIKVVDNRKVFDLKGYDKNCDNQKSTIVNQFDNQIIRILEDQLKSKDDIIRELNQRLAETTQLIGHHQKMIEQKEEKILRLEEPKKGFFKTIFNK